MKIRFIIYLLFLSILSFGQASQTKIPKKSIYKGISGLVLLKPGSSKEIIGSYFRRNRNPTLIGSGYRLDSDMTFKQKIEGCFLKKTIDSGSWYIRGTSLLVLDSSKKPISFDLASFNGFYFLIEPKRRKSFIIDIEETNNQLANIKAGQNNSWSNLNSITMETLLCNFYARALKDDTPPL